ncbi:MAG: glycosyltransferase family 4 protein [Chloroflexi bacterium]|nr:glycosyltransferase family 4 protein [Chloroflexota bacterium]
MAYRVVLYCPDRHLTYDGRTPDEVGVGGGVTARVRMARALARLGHSVIQVVNCPQREVIDGVDYVPLDAMGRIEADVAIFNTSGGALDLSPALELDLAARLRIVWLHGTQSPGGLGRLPYAALYAVSNFLARTVIDEWGIPASRLHASPNGYDPAHFDAAEAEAPEREPFQLVYFSHPSKGLDTALGVLRELRAHEPRFRLEIAGGARLWGGVETAPVQADGVHDHGLLGQTDLIRLLLRSSYSLQMQARDEPGALAIHEAARAGCVIVASPVGCYVEQITDGVNGLVVAESHESEDARASAAHRILAMHAAPRERDRIAQTARAWALDTDTLATAWTQDWQSRLGEAVPEQARCGYCSRSAWRLADGDHCPACGLFTRRLAAAVDA